MTERKPIGSVYWERQAAKIWRTLVKQQQPVAVMVVDDRLRDFPLVGECAGEVEELMATFPSWVVGVYDGTGPQQDFVDDVIFTGQALENCEDA